MTDLADETLPPLEGIAPEGEGGTDLTQQLRAVYDQLDKQEADAKTVEPLKVEPVIKEPVTAPLKDAAALDTNAAAAVETKTAPQFAHGEDLSKAVLAGDWSKVDLTRAPSSWSAAAKAEFASLPENSRKESILREAQFHKGIEEYKDSHTFAKQVIDVARPYLPLIQSKGANIQTAVQALLQTYYEIEQNPTAAVHKLAKQYGVQLQAEPQAQAYDDPRLNALQQQLAQVTQRQQQEDFARQRAMHDAQQRDFAQSQNQVAEFAKRPDAIYLENVKPLMASLLETGAAKDLPDAYQQAIKAHPQIGPIVLKQEYEAAENKRIEEARQKAANAKRAAFDVSGQGASSSGRTEISLRQQLEAGFPE